MCELLQGKIQGKGNLETEIIGMNRQWRAKRDNTKKGCVNIQSTNRYSHRKKTPVDTRTKMLSANKTLDMIWNTVNIIKYY